MGSEMISFLKKKTSAYDQKETVQIQLFGELGINLEKGEVEKEELIDASLRNSRGNEKDHLLMKESKRRQ